MTRGAGRTRGYRAQDSELRPGKTVVPFGEKTTICPACRQHKHHACWAHTAALGIGGEPGCPCGCHVPLDEPLMTDEAIDDMATHGLLAEHIKFQTAMALRSSLAIHYPEVCRRCTAIEGAKAGQQDALPLEDTRPATAESTNAPPPPPNAATSATATKTASAATETPTSTPGVWPTTTTSKPSSSSSGPPRA